VRAPIRGLPTAGAAITGTAPLPQVITSSSGLTVIRLPQQVMSGGRLVVEGRTTPYAYVAIQVRFPDGSKVSTHSHAHKSGTFALSVPISYQPQGSAEAAAVVVRAVARQTGLNDTITGSVTILQHIVLNGVLKLPNSVVPGRTLSVGVSGTLPNVLVRFYLTYPDGQQESHYGGYTDSTGALPPVQFTVSSSDGTSGTLKVTALLVYEGVERRINGTVTLRGARK
jgi:hypothetical protein